MIASKFSLFDAIICSIISPFYHLCSVILTSNTHHTVNLKNSYRMKNSTSLLLLAAAGIGLSASAQATWQRDEVTKFMPAQRTSSIMADFNNNGHLDIYYGGTACIPEFDKVPGVWPYQLQSNLFTNNGDGTWLGDTFTITENGEPQEVENEDGSKEMVQYYKLVEPTHGIAPNQFAEYFAFDYNNDGLVDLMVIGVITSDDQFSEKNRELLKTVEFRENHHGYTALYKNLGNNKFELVTDAGFPSIRTDNEEGKNMFQNAIAVGDYDHDGYTDVFITGLYNESQPEGYSGRVACLYRNMGGTGKFERQNIAEVQGDVWTSDIKDEEGNVIKNKQPLDGGGLPQSNNVHFVDVNNDGWLDLVVDGWSDATYDEIHAGDGCNVMRIYLNQEGKKFVDVTPQSEYMKHVNRGCSSSLVDFDGDGYVDFFSIGYNDGIGGWPTRFFYNQSGIGEKVFDEYEEGTVFYNENGESTDLYIENYRSVVRDFNGDGMLDIFIDGRDDSWIYYGKEDGFFQRAPQLPSRGYNGQDGISAVGDANGNGLADQFQVGYVWTEWTGDWMYGGIYYANTTETEVVAPAAPTDVKAEIKDGILTITWKDSEADTYTAGYNIFVKKPNGELFTVIPADPETGFVKISYGKESLIRPMVQSYSMAVEGDGKYTVGVQAVSFYNEKASSFSKVEIGTSGLSSVTAEAFDVKVEGDQVTALGNDGEIVTIYNTLGQAIATGLTNQPVNVSANGVLIIKAGAKTAKIVK